MSRLLARHQRLRQLVFLAAVWLLGEWLARRLLIERTHRACLRRLKRLEWEIVDHPALRAMYQPTLATVLTSHYQPIVAQNVERSDEWAEERISDALNRQVRAKR